MSNLSDIGFPVRNEQDVNDLIVHVLERVREIGCPEGLYLKFADDSGAEIYIQVNKDQELIGFNPHFGGKSRRRAGLTSMIERDTSALDGGFHAWADPSDEDFENSGEYPFVFDMPDFRAVEGMVLPSVREIQLTAFASNDFKIFQDEEEFFALQDSVLPYAARSFVPLGLQPGDNDGPPLPFGKFSGEIKDFSLNQNRFSGESFYSFLVETLGGEVDVVADVKLITTGPNIGGIVSGQFWLSGRFLET